MTAPTFLGYVRTNGDVGIRNYLLVLSIAGLTGPAARRVVRALPGARLVSMPYGGGLIGEDLAVHLRVLAGFGRNPNVGGVLLIGSDPPKVAALAAEIGAKGKPVAAICLDDCGHDVLTLTDRSLRAGARLHNEISRQRRQPVSLSKLFVGMECGRSDPSSGMVANPLIGSFVDALIQLGGRAVFGETLEWLGAEHLLARRAATVAVSDALVQAVLRRESVATRQGLDLLGNNPGPTNIAAGLSTIEEKSLGSIAKSGSSEIMGFRRPDAIVFDRRWQQLCQHPRPHDQDIGESRSHRQAGGAARFRCERGVRGRAIPRPSLSCVARLGCRYCVRHAYMGRDP
jgi:altronate dehydratase large subunit